jgi:hypothetical protein
MAKIRSIAKKIKNSPKTIKKVREIAERQLEREKEVLLRDFESHAVTREIMSGPDSENLSGTLTGYGNLFSFIGFSEGTNPVSPVRRILSEMTRIRNIRRASGNNAKMNIKIQVPSVEDFRDVAPMPWEPGRSWVEGIERGISGFSYYINSSRSSSRSGKGIQTDRRVRVMAFRNIKYMSEIIRKFAKNLKNLK